MAGATLGAAVLERWNNGSLNSSIANLRRTDPQDPYRYGSTPEDEANSDLPRAQFYIADEKPFEHMVGSTLRTATVVFEIFVTGDPDTSLDSIESVFDNCHNAGTNPISYTGGTITKFQFSGERQSGTLDDNLNYGQVAFELEWQKAFTTPA